MHIKERKTKTGISYDLFCSGRDPVSRESKVYLKTYKLPAELIGKKKATERFLLECENEWQAEVDKLSLGTVIAKKPTNIKFMDFAAEWVEDILNLHKLSHNYYIACKARLEVLQEKLGNVYLQEISPALIKNFSKWLNERTYEKKVVMVKENLRPLIKTTLRRTAEDADISHATLIEMLTIGARVNFNSAIKLCNALNIDINKYFTIEKQIIPYSANTIKGIKNMLHKILKEAVTQELIVRNYASEYMDSVEGKKKWRAIYNDEEIKQFIKCIEFESDIRKRTAFNIYLFLGLRNCETVGLEWSDIDFEKAQVNVQRNCLYVGSKFGIITKETKTKNSNRKIHVPTGLLNLLKHYKEYWDNQKELHGDLWKNTNRLFCQENGKDMAGSTLASWLKFFEKQNNLKHVSPHGLRSTHITTLIKNGVDIKTVSGRVGHSSITVTLDVYAQFSGEADKEAANKLDELFSQRLF